MCCWVTLEVIADEIVIIIITITFLVVILVVVIIIIYAKLQSHKFLSNISSTRPASRVDHLNAKYIQQRCGPRNGRCGRHHEHCLPPISVGALLFGLVERIANNGR